MLNKCWKAIKENISIAWIVYFFLGIVALNFANSFIALIVISILANAAFLILNNKKLNTEFLLTMLLSVIPLVGIVLFSMISKFNLDPDSNYSTAKYIFLALGAFSVPFLGFQSRTTAKFDIKKAIKVIYIGLAIWMLINFIITLFKFGPFYTFIYKDRYFFDYGHIARLPVDRIACMLLGFKVEYVTAELFCLVSSVLSSAVLGVFFVSFKDDKRTFFEYLICGCIGLLCIILTLNKKLMLAYIVLVLGFTLIVLFAKKIIKWNKITKIITFSLCGLAGVIYVIFMLKALNVQPLANAIADNEFLNRFFVTNRVINKHFGIVRSMADNNCLNGFTPYLVGNDTLTLSGSWFFDMFAIGQVFGWVCFIIFVVVIFIRFFKYAKESDDSFDSKVMVISLILGFLLFITVGYNSMPYFENTLYLPVFFLSPFVLIMFLYGYMGNNEEEIKI